MFPAWLPARFDGETVCLTEQVVVKAMQKHPEDRFQDAHAMQMALLDILP